MKRSRRAKKAKRSQPKPGNWRRRAAVITLFLFCAIAVSLVNILYWPKMQAKHMVLDPASLHGTGLPQDVAARLTKQPKSADDIAPAAPGITPENADQFAGLQRDPVEGFSFGGQPKKASAMKPRKQR